MQNKFEPEKSNSSILLSAENLAVSFSTGLPGNKHKIIKAVKAFTFEIVEGETFGLIGESGCGKTTLARTILGLYKPDEGKIFYRGQEITNIKKNPYQQKMQYIFQDPYGSLNPRMTIRSIISEAIEVFKLFADRPGKEKYLYNLLEMTGLTKNSLNKYPHEFSGGQRQRIAIARSLAANPEFIVCDEPVSALDVSVQAQILNLLSELQNDLNLTYLFISHDLPIIRHMSKKIGVMYKGRLIESCSAEELFSNPIHPYTRRLFASSTDEDIRRTIGDQSSTGYDQAFLNGENKIENFTNRCDFYNMCNLRTQYCQQNKPVMREIIPGHMIRCHFT